MFNFEKSQSAQENDPSHKYYSVEYERPISSATVGFGFGSSIPPLTRSHASPFGSTGGFGNVSASELAKQEEINQQKQKILSILDEYSVESSNIDNRNFETFIENDRELFTLEKIDSLKCDTIENNIKQLLTLEINNDYYERLSNIEMQYVKLLETMNNNLEKIQKVKNLLKCKSSNYSTVKYGPNWLENPNAFYYGKSNYDGFGSMFNKNCSFEEQIKLRNEIKSIITQQNLSIDDIFNNGKFNDLKQLAKINLNKKNLDSYQQELLFKMQQSLQTTSA